MKERLDSKMKMQNDMGDLVELLLIIGSLESQYRRSIEKGS